MNQLFAERFKSARLMNGFSLQDLSDKLGNKISRQALHKYEKGEVMPDSEMLDILCETLKVRPDYFTRETIVELGTINFRKLSKLPPKEQRSIVERTREVLSRYVELEEILGFKKAFKHPLPNLEINNMEDIELAAEDIRKQWKLGTDPISNVVELLEENNIKVIEIDENDEFDGLQTWVNDKDIPVIVLNVGKLKSKDRKRFTALHELGHLLLPLDDVDEKMSEKYCHRFAGAMLFPQTAVKKEIGESRNKISIQELGFLKQEYGISIQAIIYRIRDLGIISDHYMKYYFQYIIQMGWKVEEPYEYIGKESSNRFDQLLYRALVENIISMSKAASLKNMKLAEFRSNSLIVG
jgi:Zn-dependent peptidase ImmA (M78 family)/DNA-binding XRE family transcriptional regulator